MTTVEVRLIRLEGVYEHLATKADIADLRSEMLIANQETSNDQRPAYLANGAGSQIDGGRPRQP